jgi:hypothetical protein
MHELQHLSELLRERNGIDARISQLIGRPALQGHIGEFIGSKVFDIELERSATQKAIDGRFRSGPLAGPTVNIKFYAKQESVLDIHTTVQPDYYLVLAGPESSASSSRGKSRPLVVDHVYLFHAGAVVEAVRRRNVKVGIATSVPKRLWREAEIYPAQRNAELPVSPEQHSLLALFSSNACTGPRT